MLCVGRITFGPSARPAALPAAATSNVGTSMNLPSYIIANKLDAHANTAVVVTVVADTNLRYILAAVIWSYSKVPQHGKLTISGGAVPLEFDIVADGPKVMDLSFYQCENNKPLTVTLAAGGKDCTGKLNVIYQKRGF